MKNLVKITTTIILSVAMVVVFSGVVNADSVLFNNNNNTTNNTTNETTNNTTNNTPVNNTTPSGGILNNTNVPTNNTPVNNTTPVVVNKTEETIPKTGENDIFIVAGVGVIALAIGAVAYRNSKKYSI